jgi:hypothetical protein
VVRYTPFQVFDVASFHDSESEEVLEEPLDLLDPSCYNKGDDVIENIDDFIHVGRCKWDVICFDIDGDPIYDIEGCFQMKDMELFPSKQPYVVSIDLDVWKHEDNMITNLFQPPKDDLLKHSHNDF